MVRKLATIFVSALFTILPLTALAQLTPGTTLIGTIDQNLSSNHVQVGTPVSVSGAHSPDNNITGATIYGHVSSYQAASQGRAGKINLTFDKVVTRSGNTYYISGYTTNVDVQTKSNALKEVGGAAAGALVGGLIGHGVGALLGAAGGALVAKNNKENVNIPQGSTVQIQVTRARRQA